MSNSEIRLAVLGSGQGSNFQALHEAGFQIVLVISDHPDACILKKAKQAGIPTAVAKNSVEICQLLKPYSLDLICLAGFMRLIKEPLLSAFPGRILNIHPSLLPAYPGLMAWQQAIDDGATESGCTVHYVDAGMDTGKIILQAKIPVLPDDTAQSLQARIQAEEHRVYPDAVRIASPLKSGDPR